MSDIVNIYNNNSESTKHTEIYNAITLGDEKEIQSYATLINNLDTKDSPKALAESISGLKEVGAFLYIQENTSDNITHITNKFYISSIQFSKKERVQFSENLTASSATFFDSGVPVYSIRGVLLEGPSSNEEDPGEYFQHSSLLDMYDSVLRGTRLVAKNSRAVMKILNHTIEGYPIDFTSELGSDGESLSQFSMDFIVVNHKMTLAGIVTSKRLKSMYSVNYNNNFKYTEILNKIDSIIKDINSIIDPSLDKTFDSSKIFNYFSTLNTSAIIQSSSFINFITLTTTSVMTDYFNYLDTKTSSIKSTLTEINSIFPFSISSLSFLFSTFINKNENTIDATKNECTAYLSALTDLKQKLSIQKIKILYK